jgi:hypothetical protein
MSLRDSSSQFLSHIFATQKIYFANTYAELLSCENIRYTLVTYNEDGYQANPGCITSKTMACNMEYRQYANYIETFEDIHKTSKQQVVIIL